MQNYNYCLGIDLGIASIGTALIRLDKDGKPVGILDAGVRIFDTPMGAADRRQKRQERKTIRRRRQRLQILRRFLHENGLLGDVSLKAGSNPPIVCGPLGFTINWTVWMICPSACSISPNTGVQVF